MKTCEGVVITLTAASKVTRKATPMIQQFTSDTVTVVCRTVRASMSRYMVILNLYKDVRGVTVGCGVTMVVFMPGHEVSWEMNGYTASMGFASDIYASQNSY